MERQRISTPYYVGSSPTGDAIYPLSSVGIEHVATNHGVGSSSLSVGARYAGVGEWFKPAVC